MKNKYMEQLRLSHKLHGKGRGKGFKLIYDYSFRSSEKGLTYWDDLYFWLNGIRYFVAFVHPRQKYASTCEQIVWDSLYPSCPENKETFVPYEYKRVGKSRKKVKYYTMEDSNEDAFSEWCKMLWEEEKLFCASSDVCIRPSVRVKWLQRGKMIEICAPYELLSEEQALFFVGMVMEHYKTGTLYEWVDKMKAVVYTKENWIKENN